MRQTAIIFAGTAILGAAGVSALTAQQAVGYFENQTKAQIDTAMSDTASDWATVTIDGLRVNVFGTAPSERDRFAVLEALSATVSGKRIKDRSNLAGEASGTIPNFSLDILRNGNSFTMTGQVPKSTGSEMLIKGLDTKDGAEFTDILEHSDYTPPAGWGDSLKLALFAARQFEHGTINVKPGEVVIDALANTQNARAEMQAAINGARPDSVELSLNIDAPLPTIAPFMFSFSGSDATARLSNCSASDEASAQRILAEIENWGGDGDCEVGLGTPSAEWEPALLASLKALKALGGGTLVVENADIRLTALHRTDTAKFTAITNRLVESLPELFTLHAVLPEIPEPSKAPPPPPKLVAERTEAGTVVLTGDLPDGMLSRATTTFAEAQFGFDQVEAHTTVRGDLPNKWSNRVLAGIEALALLNIGKVEITPDLVHLTGEAQDDRVEEEMLAVLAVRLPPETEIQIDIVVNPREPVEIISEKRAELCEAQIASLLSSAQIIFPPGGTQMDENSLAITKAVATILQDCPGSHFEIGGHTDSQGRESSNLAISQSRAAAVMDALLRENVNKVFLIATGYGESQAIADNETEDGRAANRRIEFKLVKKSEEEPRAAVVNGDPLVSTSKQSSEDVASDDKLPEPLVGEGDETALETRSSSVDQPSTESAAEEEPQETLIRPKPRDLD